MRILTEDVDLKDSYADGSGTDAGLHLSPAFTVPLSLLTWDFY